MHISAMWPFVSGEWNPTSMLGSRNNKLWEETYINSWTPTK